MKGKFHTAITLIFWGIIAIIVLGLLFVHHSGGNNIFQSYWYCWDVGNPDPHHLGHHVMGDHLCTDKELGR